MMLSVLLLPKRSSNGRSAWTYSVFSGMSAPLSRPNVSKQPAVVIAERARVNLHHQAVFLAHLRHLDQHGRAEQLGIGGRELARSDFFEQTLRLDRTQVRRWRRSDDRGRSSVARALAKSARRLRCALSATLPRVNIFTRDLRRSASAHLLELLVLGIDHGIRAIGSDDPPLPAAALNFVMMVERIDRRLGGRRALRC